MFLNAALDAASSAVPIASALQADPRENLSNDGTGVKPAPAQSMGLQAALDSRARQPRGQSKTLPPVLVGGYCQRLLQNGAAGSALEEAYKDDFRGAHAFVDFLRGDLRGAIPFMGTVLGFDPSSASEMDVFLGVLMAHGKARLSSARTAAAHLLVWLRSQPFGQETPFEVLSAGLKPMQLACYFSHVTTESRARATSLERECKDTAAGARLSDLKAFCRITSISTGELESPLLKFAVPPQPKSSAAPVEASTMSVAAQAHFEYLAAHHPSPFVRHAAGVASLMGICSLRGQEAIRCCVISGPESLDADDGTLLHLRCQQGKGRNRQEMYPFDVTIFCEGFLGDARPWLVPMCELMRDRPCIMAEFMDDTGKFCCITDATTWALDRSITADHLAGVLIDLCWLKPYAASPENLRASGWNLHAPHSLGSCLVRTLLDQLSFSDVDAHEIGRWEHGAAGTRLLKKGSMPLRYSGGNAAHEREADLRRRACRAVSSFLDGRLWFKVLDTELGRKPSYFFLRGEASAIAEEAPKAPATAAPPTSADADEVDEPPNHPPAGQHIAALFDPSVFNAPPAKRKRKPVKR